MSVNISKSLRDHVLASIESILYQEKFPTCDVTPIGILEAIDLLSGYQEEGQQLFPEIILTTDIEIVLLTLPSRIVHIYEGELNIEGFKKAIKLCAPLAIDGWVIFIETRKDQNHMKFGLCTAEISEISPTLFEQLFGEKLKTDIDDSSIIYIRNVGLKTVQLTGMVRSMNVSFTLKDNNELNEEYLQKLCGNISRDCEDGYKEKATFLFEKLIEEANRTGHGTLIGVIQEEKFTEIQKHLDGTFLSKSIDLVEFFKNSEIENTRAASTNMRQYSNLVKSMIKSDGITVFTTTGKIIGYHVFIDLKEIDTSNVIGGARSRAFEAMKVIDFFECCFFKSQDGNEKYWNK